MTSFFVIILLFGGLALWAVPSMQRHATKNLQNWLGIRLPAARTFGWLIALSFLVFVSGPLVFWSAALLTLAH